MTNITTSKTVRTVGPVDGPRAFTLVEMLVVVTIVLITLSLVLPAASTMWDQRKIADAENTVRGLLITSRANSLRASGVESGILFYVDDGGTQRMLSIERDEQGRLDCKEACLNTSLVDLCSNSCELGWGNVFRVTEDRQHRLPSPMRVVPRYVVESGDVDTEFFSEEELANNVFDVPEDGDVEFDQAQRHRNYFTMIFSSDGRLLVRRDVLIRDDDRDAGGQGDTFGDLTGMLVEYDHDNDEPTVTAYHSQDNEAIPIELLQNTPVPFLVVDGDDEDQAGGPVAINFPSVDGLLVYDDALFNGFDSDKDKRDFLLETARPFYVSRLTGAIIQGPRGETERDSEE